MIIGAILIAALATTSILVECHQDKKKALQEQYEQQYHPTKPLDWDVSKSTK